MLGSIFISCGGYLPEKILTNEDISQQLDTTDEWITQRTGIKKRHIAAEGELTSDLASRALLQALTRAGLNANDIDGIIVATSTPDLTLPSTACAVQQKVNSNNNCFAFDINAACSGFVYAVTIADNMLSSGKYRRIAVIGADTYSRIIDWQDRSTCILFGDGAGCIILEKITSPSGMMGSKGIISATLNADGSLYDILKTDGGVSKGNRDAKLQMNGREVFRHAVSSASDIIKETLHQAKLDAQDLDLLIPHQANFRISSSLAKELDIAPEKIASTIAHHANTSAASIPLAMDHYLTQGLLKPGQLVAICGFGAGFTAGCVIMRI